MITRLAPVLLSAGLAAACGGTDTGAAGPGQADSGQSSASQSSSGTAPGEAAAQAPVPAPEVPAVEPPPQRRPVVVDLEEHFPGLADAFFSARAAAYPIDFEEFEALHGQEIDTSELEAMQERWREAKLVGDAAEPPAVDPAGSDSAAPVEERVADSAFLSEALDEFVRFDDLDHFVLFVQPRASLAGDAAEQQATGVRRKYGAMVDGLERLFIENYAEPLELEKRPSLHPYVLFLLDGRAAYDAYSRAAETDLRHARAHYDPQMHVEISYLDAGFETDSNNMHAMLHELVHGIEQAYYSGSGDAMPPATWFTEGFAEYLAYERIALIQAASKRSKQRWKDADEAVSRLGRQVARDDALAACVLPLEVLNTIRGYGDAQFEFRERAYEHGMTIDLDHATSQELLYAQSFAWMAFLHGDQDEPDTATTEWRDDVKEYIRHLLSGDPPDAALRAAFAGDELARVNADFLDFLRAHDGAALAELVARTR